jgi:hypothetical protein
MSADGQVIEFVNIVQRLTTPWGRLLFRLSVRDTPLSLLCTTTTRSCPPYSAPAHGGAITLPVHAHAPRPRQEHPCPLLPHIQGLTFL